MMMWNLGEDAVQSLQLLPETGMGFQLVEAVVMGSVVPLLVLNSETALDLREINLLSGDDPAVILQNGLRVIEAMKSPLAATFSASQPRIIRLLHSRIGHVPNAAGTAVPGGPQIALPSSLVKHVILPANRTFSRFSAFHPDRRVDPLTGSFLPGTYAAPQSEVPFVPTGFVAVGRFALPNNLPASYLYEIEAPAGTKVDFGTVAPAFGQSGGGVEAYFSNAVVNAKVPPSAVGRLPDE